jgi:phosphoglycolate phosphatase
LLEKTRKLDINMQIFFDLDGPILDVSERYYTVYTDLLTQSGCPTISKTEYWDAKRERISESEILARTCPPALIKDYAEKRLSVIENIFYLKLDRVRKDMPALLNTLSRYHQLYIVTIRNSTTTLMQQLKYFDLLKYFTDVYSQTNNDGNWIVKYDFMQDAINDPRSAIMVGDTEVDIQAGRKSGILTCGLVCGIRNLEYILKAKPDVIYRYASEFLGTTIMNKKILRR